MPLLLGPASGSVYPRYVRYGPCIEGTLRLKFQFPRAQEILGSSDKLLKLQHSSGRSGEQAASRESCLGPLADWLELLRVLLEAPHVNVRGCGDPPDSGIIEAAHGAGRGADDQRSFGKAFSFGNQRTGADQAIVPDPRAIEQNCAHADQAVGPNHAAMQDNIMTDHAIRPDRHREAGIGVQSGIVLNLRALAELDPFVVAAQDRAKPDAGIALKPHLADQGRRRRDPIAALLRQFRTHSVEFIDHAEPP